MEAAILIGWFVAATACGSWVGHSMKGRPLTGFLLGLVFGWVGVGVTLLLPPTIEKRVQRKMRDDRVLMEATRREAGHVPWTGDATQ